MTFKERYYNKDTLNIFVDASIKKCENETIGCPGAIAIYNNSVLDYKMDILRNSTNNNSEIMAIYYGILLAIKYRDKFKYINLFSDSKICVFGLKEWIFNWIKTVQIGSDNIEDYTQEYNMNILYGSTGTPVANQSEIMLVVQTILAYNLELHIYHQRGHICTKNESMLQKAMHTFIENNNLFSDEIDLATMSELSYYNNTIDDSTRKFLNSYSYHNESIKNPAIFFMYNKDMDINKYSKLLNLSSLK